MGCFRICSFGMFQTDYEKQEKIGTLDCGHEYHADCVKRWLLVKNTCPICKSSALTEGWFLEYQFKITSLSLCSEIIYVNIVEAMLFCLYQAMLFCLYPACQNYVLLRHVCLSNSYIRSCCWLFDHGSRAVNVTMYIFLTKLNVKSCWLTSKLIILLPVGERFFFSEEA